MDKQISIPVGAYSFSAGKFESGGVRYYIKQRKTESAKKPRQYLFALNPDFTYISSLYSVEQSAEIDRYQIDYSGEVFLLDFEPGKVEIHKVQL